MRLNFENWFNNNDLPQETIDLFNESVICYKMQAYRSAYIMAYIGFLALLYHRIAICDLKPIDYPNDSCWIKTKKKLQNEDNRESILNDIINNKSQKTFYIKDSTINEFNVLRNYRNIAAHGKTTTIEIFHIEFLWSFIQNNNLNFFINNGKKGIIQLLEKHYDLKQTSIDTSPIYIIKQIEICIKDDETDNFLEELDNNIIIGNIVFNGIGNNKSFYDYMLENSLRLHNAIIEYVKKRYDKKFDIFLNKYPHFIKEFLEDKSFLRELCFGNYFKSLKFFDSQQPCWKVFKYIINNDLVENNEKKSLYPKLCEYIGTKIYDEYTSELTAISYWDYIRNKIFNPNDYNNLNAIYIANENSFIFVKLLNQFGLSKEAVECINLIFAFAKFGCFFDNICNWMKANNNIDKYKNIVQQYQLQDFSEKFNN